jgi:uncharacterized membrane protein YgaE (UPF0421/DUF939 family)
MFAILKRYENSHAFAVSSFITAVLAIMLKQLNIISDQVLIISIVLASVMILFTLIKND